MEWHYVDNGKQVGPISEGALQTLVGLGQIHAHTLVWRQGMENWQTWGSLTGAVAMAPPSPNAAADPFVQVQEQYAGFWRRAAAHIIDGIITGVVVSFPLLLVSDPTTMLQSVQQALDSGDYQSMFTAAGSNALWSALFTVIFHLFYKTLMVGRFGGTVGYLALRLRVVNADFSAVDYGRAFARFAAEMPFEYAGYLGKILGILSWADYLSIVVDGEKRAIHDMMCNTRVVVARR